MPVWAIANIFLLVCMACSQISLDDYILPLEFPLIYYQVNHRLIIIYTLNSKTLVVSAVKIGRYFGHSHSVVYLHYIGRGVIRMLETNSEVRCGRAWPQRVSRPVARPSSSEKPVILYLCTKLSIKKKSSGWQVSAADI